MEILVKHMELWQIQKKKSWSKINQTRITSLNMLPIRGEKN